MESRDQSDPDVSYQNDLELPDIVRTDVPPPRINGPLAFLGFGLVASVFYILWDIWSVLEVSSTLLPLRVRVFFLTTTVIETLDLLFTVFVAYKFFWKKKAAQFWMIAWLWINLAILGLIYLHALSVPELERIALFDTEFRLVLGLFIAVGWTIYLVFSKKVRNTFVY